MSWFEPTMQARSRVSVLREMLEARKPLKACVVGAGQSGRAAARLLSERGCLVTVVDDRGEAALGPEAPGGPALPFTAMAVDAADLVILSPGVPRQRPELRTALEVGKAVGEVEVASWFVRAPMVGITGTNGKSTTTALVGHGFQRAGRAAFVGGNLGTPLSELARSQEPVDVAVVELSSFQLESLVEARFAVGVWLNLSPDHQDRYSSTTEYAMAKRRVIEQRRIDGVGVLNAKDPYCLRLGLELGGPLRWFSAEPHSDLAGPLGTVVDGPEATRRVVDQVERYDVSSLPGRHNRANAAAAIEVWRQFGMDEGQVADAIRTFPGLPHRLERIPSRDGIEWVNDSKATNVEAVVAALEASDRPTVWLAGGRDKHGPLEPLVQAIQAGRVKAVLVFGEAAQRMERALSQVASVESVHDLEQAVSRARAWAEPGDRVLLSPACASFDQYRNFEERGDHFRALVERRP